MADVEFEPLHGENEEDSEFMLERRKKDSSGMCIVVGGLQYPSDEELCSQLW